MSQINFKKNRTKNKLNYTFPVVVVSRSNKNICAQVLEPITKKTLFSCDSSKVTGISKIEQSKKVGENIAKFLNSRNFNKVVFDRNGYVYHGRVKQVAESIKEQNILI